MPPLAAFSYRTYEATKLGVSFEGPVGWLIDESQTGYYIMQDRSGGKASDQYKVAYFEPDKWYNLRIEYNRNTQVQYLYVNDVCVWGGTSMLVGTTEGEFTAIYFQMREKANKYYDVYFDNTGSYAV